jgi:hypothetical protein
MELNSYQEQLKNYEKYPKELGPYYLILGVQSEVGKLSEKLKIMLDSNETEVSERDKTGISISIGDIILYLSSIASSLNIPLDNIAALSLRKLSLLKEKELNKN